MSKREKSPPPSATLTQTMCEQLTRGTYECMVCTDVIRAQVATWSCSHCYRTFHLFCIKKWSKSEESGQGMSFRCPSCQTSIQNYPNRYTCFCGKVRDPVPSSYYTPHSCGDECGKRRANSMCPHPCNMLCHPGPCSECNLHVPPKKCPCGRSTYTHSCGKPDPLTCCSATCGKKLNCGMHTCENPCHHGPCKPCEHLVKAQCHCKRTEIQRKCGDLVFSCNAVCDKPLSCGNHKCQELCHPGACGMCPDDPRIVKTCPCGKSKLEEERKTCLDPIPTCRMTCGKAMKCGKHTCPRPCHNGDCGDCVSMTNHPCPCGSKNSTAPCRDVTSDYRCSKRCKAQLSCGKHECEVVCCPDRLKGQGGAVHRCQRKCNKKLPCGHQCSDDCHRGPCPSCIHIVTVDLSCACGSSVLQPPQPCGTKAPPCNRPCQIVQPCGHTVSAHNCHFGPCPMCVEKVDKLCAGGHCIVPSVLCHATEVCCGKPCGKSLPCGHQCSRKCHSDACGDKKGGGGVGCGQKCNKTLPCSHRCNQKCHTKNCPPCNTEVEVKCDCGFKKKVVKCRQYLEMKAELEHTLPGQNLEPSIKCDDDCIYNRRLTALASVGASRPTANSKGTRTVYSIRLWHLAGTCLDAVIAVEKHFVDFVKGKEQHFMLPKMSRERRSIAHDLSLYFRVQCESVDQEPNRTCYLTRQPNSMIPTPLLSEAVYNEENNPERIVERLMASNDVSERTIVFRGESATENSVGTVLRMCAGQYILSWPKPGTCYAVFLSTGDMHSAFAALRRSMTPLTFHRIGEDPPPKMVNGIMQVTQIPSQPSSSTSFASGKKHQVVEATAPHVDPGKSWAQMMRNKKQAPAKPSAAEAKESLAAANMFSALKRK